jgi:hypothetical protein
LRKAVSIDMARKRQRGNFGNYGSSSFSRISKQESYQVKPVNGGFNNNLPKIEGYRVQPLKAAFGGSLPNTIYTSDREAAWSRWRRGWELAAANGVERPFFYDFRYKTPVTDVDIIGSGRAPFVSGSLQGFLTDNKELGMHWAGKVNAGNLRLDRITDQQGTRLAISGEVPTSTLFLGKQQDNTNYWYVQLSGTFSSGTVSGVSAPVPPPFFVTLSGGSSFKPANGDILEDKIITVSGDPIDQDTLDPNTGKRYGFIQAVLADVDQNQGILKIEKLGSVQATIDSGVLQTPARSPFHSGRFLQSGARYACTCQDFTRRNYAYLSTVGLYKKPQFSRAKVSTIKPGRTEEMLNRGNVLNAAQQQITQTSLDNRFMTIVYPSGQDNQYSILGVSLSESGKILEDPKTLYRDNPAVFNDFGGIYRRGFGDDPNPSGVAEGMPKYGDYKQSGLDITEISDTWTYTLDQYRYCKHIYAMKFADGEFPNEPSDFPVSMELMSEWENKLVMDTEKSQRKAFERLAYYGLGYMDTPPFNVQSPMMSVMMQKLINMPQEFIQIQNFFMVDSEGTVYNVASGERPAAPTKQSNYVVRDWRFASGVEY